MSKAPPRAREGEEIWESTTEGLVWVPTMDTRGRERVVKVGGRVGSRLRITTVDRELAEDRLDDMDSGPFRNGMLVRVDAGSDDRPDGAARSEQELSTEDLIAGFAKNGNAFHSFVGKLNEVNTRRMLDLAPAVDASTSQLSFLQETIRERYRPAGEGAQPAYTEMQRRGELAGNI